MAAFVSSLFSLPAENRFSRQATRSRSQKVRVSRTPSMSKEGEMRKTRIAAPDDSARGKESFSEKSVQNEMFFPRFAEKVNGRFAQIGFLVGLATEFLTNKSIPEQLDILFSIPPYLNEFASYIQQPQFWASIAPLSTTLTMWGFLLNLSIFWKPWFRFDYHCVREMDVAASFLMSTGIHSWRSRCWCRFNERESRNRWLDQTVSFWVHV